jgi:hypothetical protein
MRIRTLNFLPEVFHTPTNAQFLNATLDQLVNPPVTQKIQGYIGSKLGYGINAKDYYVTEPTKVRTDYQLDPGVVFTKKNESTAYDFLSYPGIIDSLKLQGGITNNNSDLFTSEIYSWDSFTNLDKLINFNQYYWLPFGPPAVTVASDIVYSETDYVVTSEPNNYNIRIESASTGSDNPTITLLRGGTYTFTVDQASQFFIQGQPGVTGYSITQPNLSTRDILGVTNNGANVGTVTFNVPLSTAQNQYILPGSNTVDVISTVPYANVNGGTLSSIGGSIDGVTSLNGLTVMFYNTGVTDPLETTNFYTITTSGSPSNPTLTLTPSTAIPSNQKITASFGTVYNDRNFYKSTGGTIELIPYISANLDTLYYQDGSVANRVGVIRIIDSNLLNIINVNEDILGQTNYTSPNGVIFTNGLKVDFVGDIIPSSYANGTYYVEGVGTGIQLIPTDLLVNPEPFTTSAFIPYDTTPYDIGNYDTDLFILSNQDYITIARNSLSYNPWSRSNRWFHIEVINATAEYNNDPNIVTDYATYNNKAKRPIIEFYPNLKLYECGSVAKNPTDFIDLRTTDAFSLVAGHENYYPDVNVYTAYDCTINGVVNGTSTTINIPSSGVVGTFVIGQYIADLYEAGPSTSPPQIPDTAQITAISGLGTSTITLTINWTGNTTITTVNNASIIATEETVNNYALFEGCRVIFNNDTDNISNKIYVVTFAELTPGGTPVISLTEAPDGQVENNNQVVILRGANNIGKSYYYDIDIWKLGQQKTNVNQAPYFDVFDSNGISFGNTDIYIGSSFAGSKLFAYGIGSGPNDILLGFPIQYSSIDNPGDISFDVVINSQTFDYVTGSTPITQNINTGYVYNYSSLIDYTRMLGWQTCVSPSVQYQVFEFNYFADNPTNIFTCDVPALTTTETNWPVVKVFINNVFQEPTNYTYNISGNNTIVNLTVDGLIDTVVQVLVLSNEVSENSYFTVPLNLSNNPFNTNITTANIGDIRSQYSTIFMNNPNMTGVMFGSNNYRDLGNLVPYGNAIIQNSSPLTSVGSFLRLQNHNIFDSLQFNSREYVKFKTLLIDTVNQIVNEQNYTASTYLDDALDIITSTKNQEQPFFWSDMLPSKAPYLSRSYTFNNDLETSIFPLSRVYDFSKANYNGVLVYVSRIVSGTVIQLQLIKGTDYVISTDSPSLTVSFDLLAGDIVTINEYNQTYGSYVPNTPTKLGLYPSFIPTVILDSTYTQPTYFIIGHDGSYTKTYGNYNTTLGVLEDFRDQALLEFERRIYNNLKLSQTIPVSEYEVVPGYFRTTDLTWAEFLEIYSKNFLDWVGQNRLDYKSQYYDNNNQFTYNYSDSGIRLDNKPILQGYWRGVYEYFYDTSQPNTSPWEMLGYTSQPSWWTSVYGPSPYTSDNLVLWGDLANGYDYNNGNPVIREEFIRPGLLNVLPVDSNGNLVSPLSSIVGNYTSNTFQREWKVGDDSPVELSYRRSSTWPYDLMRILALTKPAKFFNLGIDLDNYLYNTEFNQYLVNNRSHLVLDDVEIYGSGVAKTSYINWIVDYEKQLGVNATTNITDLLFNLDVRLVYRVAGYSDKTLLKFYVEKGSPNSTNASLLIPDESYSVLLYENQPFDRIIYTSIIIQRVTNGYAVYGNSQNRAYFSTLSPKYDGFYDNITVEGLSAKITKNFTTPEQVVPYGYIFNTVQETSQFIANYGSWLIEKGMIFDQIENGVEINWRQMIGEFLYWAQTGWDVGSIVTLSPAATQIKIDRDSYIVQPLTLQQSNFILNQSLYPIQNIDLSIVRDQTLFNVQPLNEGDSLSYGQFNISNFEHGIVFDNTTVFDDRIYNLVTGLRQNRILVKGVKTAEWNGTVTASGFILNQDNITEWRTAIAYTKGQIVKYKNKYWVALKKIEPSSVFNELDWKETDYNEIQKGLLPNSSTRSYESSIYYNINEANLEQDADLLGFSLIGYRPRDYLALVDLTDTAQINVYRNFIRNKGTRNSLDAFKGARLPQGGIDYDIYENWAIKLHSFGGTLNDNFAEFRLRQNLLTGNPSIVSLTNGIPTIGSQQEVPLYSLFNYGSLITNPNILPTTDNYTPQIYPSAGYVNFNDVKMSSYFYNGLPTAVNEAGVIVPIEDFYVRDYVWLANFLGTWQVYTWQPLGQIILARGNNDGTTTIRFSSPQNIPLLTPIAIVNFSSLVDGYYIVTRLVNNSEVIINLTLDINLGQVTGYGVVSKFASQRVTQPSDIINLPLLNAEFIKNTVWVDEDTDGNWSVYRKGINYTFDNEKTKTNSDNFGSSVAFTTTSGYLIGDSGLGELYRYTYNIIQDDYELSETITESVSFGTAITYTDNFYFVSEPTSGSPKVYVYVINDSTESTDLIQLQTLTALGGSTNYGASLSISNDRKWLYVGAPDINRVYVYRQQYIPLSAGYFVNGEVYTITEVGTTDFTLIGALENKIGITFVATGIGSGNGTATQISYEYSTYLDGSILGDNYGITVSTDYYGDTLVVGAPSYDQSISATNWGRAYMYHRTVQNIEVQSNSYGGLPQLFSLGWTPAKTTVSVTNTTATTNLVTISNTAGLSVNDPIIFTGTGYGSSLLETEKVYYISSINSGAPGTITLKTSRTTNTNVTLNTETIGSGTAYIQTTPLYVTVNGRLVQDNNYAVISTNTFVYTGDVLAGDIINVSDNIFTLLQTFESESTPRPGVQFGISVGVTRTSNEIIVGAPFEISSQNSEGVVYRYTNGGGRYGVIIGTDECYITVPRKMFINGFLVILPVGDVNTTVNAINSTQVPNVQASATTDGKLIISVVDQNLSVPNEKLLVSVIDIVTLDELGFEIYTKTQTVLCPHLIGASQFGSVVKFNEFDSFVVSAPVGTRYSFTTFDFTDDENFENDTVFDNNATQFVDMLPNAGAVYMFDYLPSYNESLSNVGNFVYAQSCNDTNQNVGSLPRYGLSLDFNEYKVMVGSPYYQPNITNGQVVIYQNNVGIKDWSIYRRSSSVVDINKMQNLQIFSAETNDTLINLDYFDPLQGKLLGAVRENLDYVSNADPANYNSLDNTQSGLVWGANKVGLLWYNTSNTRFVNYHQNDVVYNSKYWGSVFPGSNVTVYSWVASNVIPSEYEGPGTPFDITKYTTQEVLNASNLLSPVYYFWVRNTNVIFRKTNKTLADSVIEQYINSPINSGISYLSPLLPNTFGLYNCQSYFDANDSVLHIGYSTGTSSDVPHNEYTLIRANYADDFLPGVPTFGSTERPTSLYDRLLDSLCGVDEEGGVVPNPFLPLAVQSGILVRPRQSFFYDRFLALKNYLQYANTICKQFPILEIRTPSYLYTSGLYFDTQDYWTKITWWAPGYDDNTKPALQVNFYADLSTLNVNTGTVVAVGQNNGSQEYYVYGTDRLWTRIGLQNGTIEFNSTLWDYAEAKLGFGDNFFDTSLYDEYPSEETRYIVRALNEQIYIDDLLVFRNKSLILLFEYIQSETTESQNYLPWLNKTSLVDVSHKIRELLPFEVYQTDNQDFLAGYLNETKPYHVVIKDFLFTYTGTDVYEGDITDFDLPSSYNSNFATFISPQLVYNSVIGDNQYLPNNSIWTNNLYSQWFNNRGVSLTGETNYQITTLAVYMTLGSTVIVVDNASGFPVNGVITIGTEKIVYSNVDRAANILSNLQRGYNDTDIQYHLPGELIYIDLPPVLLLNSGRDYTEPPKITAYIDTTIYPEPLQLAVLEPVMSLDKVIDVNVINPGQGYAVLPEIRIDPSLVITFSSVDVNLLLNTIRLFAPTLVTGDLVQYKVGTGTSIGGLVNSAWYYINLLEDNPSPIIALYTSYGDAVNNRDRVVFSNAGTGSDHTLNLGARASAISTSYPIREIDLTLRYDRTTYTTQVIDWRPGEYYGAFYAGRYSNSENIASSSITLQSVLPPINTILASAQGVAFEIVEVTNDRTIDYSNFVRNVLETVDVGSGVAEDRYLVRLTYDYNDPNAPGSTIGFTVGMPVKFIGLAIGGLVADTTYYVKKVINNSDFSISSTQFGSALTLTNANVTPAGLECFTAQIIDQGIITVNYPSIVEVTETFANTNKLLAPISAIGTGGTSGLYTNISITFTGNVFGNIVENEIYYVTSVADSETFTISRTLDPITTTLTNTNTSNIITVDSTTDFNLNDPIIFNQMVITVGNFVIGQKYTILTLGNTDYTVLGAKENLRSLEFIATSTGLVTAGSFVPGKQYVIQSLGTVLFNAGSFVPGNAYEIVSVGTTDFTLIGAANNSVGTIFTATGVGSGSGTANYITDFTLIGSSENVVGATFIATGFGTGPGTATQGSGTVAVTSFGNINQGTVYYVQNILNSTQLKISTVVNGSELTLSNQTGTATLINQKDVVQLTNATGSMNMNVSLPVSPGQVNGQLFTLYQTSGQYPSISSGTVSNLISRTINATLATVDKIALRTPSRILSATSNFYYNMPLVVDSNIGNLTTGIIYYVIEYTGRYDSNTDTTTPGLQVTVTTVSGSVLTCDDTNNLYVGMPIIFSGNGIGSVVIDLEYYVHSIINGTQFRLSNTNGGTIVTFVSGVGSMIGTGDDFIQVSTSIISPTVVTLSDADGPSTIEQTTTTITPASFDVSYTLGGYQVVISDQGSGYAVNNTVTIPGNLIGGVTTTNDLTIEVNSIGTMGEITSVIKLGTPAGNVNQYYLKVISINQFELYSNKQLTIPVSGLTLPYEGFTSSTVTGATSSVLTIDTTGFNEYDSVVFTGSVPNVITEGYTYYLYNVTPTTTQITTIPNDISSIVGSITFTSDFTMAKAGSFALLPEPFSFNRSIVRYNNKVWECIVSNNDDDFVFGKWVELNSGDRKLNALDRAFGYYQPTDNMPGRDLTQAFTGLIYPNTTYLGNAFAPEDQYNIDTFLQDQPFYPTDIDNVAITNNGTIYLGAANTNEYSGLITSTNTTSWEANGLTSLPIGFTDIIYAGGYYIVTTTNTATPIFYSSNGTVWTSSGAFTPYSSTPYDVTPWDVSALSVPADSLNSVGYKSNTWVAVGSSIVTATNVSVWNTTFTFTTYTNTLYGVNGVTTTGFNGFIAVGAGQEATGSGVINCNVIVTSLDGLTWTRLGYVSLKGFYGVSSNGTVAVAVGEDGVIYNSQNGSDWYGINESTILSVNSVSDTLIVDSTIGVNVNDVIRFNNSFSSITTGTSYYIVAIPTSNQIQISTSLGGPVLTLTAGTPSDNTYYFTYPTTDTLYDISYAGGVFVTVGDNGLIRTSSDGITWTTRTSGTTRDLRGITYNSGIWIVVGLNNTILKSTDNGITWTDVSSFITEDPAYTVKGDSFLSGYGPEELVPGVVSDNLTMIVNTRPGTNWSATEYQNVGYNVVSIEFTPTPSNQVTYSFDEIVQVPAQVALFEIVSASGLSTSLYETLDYTVNWINNTITLNSSLPVGNKLRLDVYEVGNGDQLVKSNTKIDPLLTNSVTGFNEIVLNCNYSENIYLGSGVLRTGSSAIEETATQTDSVDNTIVVGDASKFTLNSPIYFQGTVFGGIVANNTYYVKTISIVTNRITVSSTFNLISGLAGPTLTVTDATGSMTVIIRTGTGSVWTEPYVAHNGTKLILGKTGTVNATIAATDTVVVNSTGGMVAGTQIVFSSTMFGGVLTPLTPYNILVIVDGNEFQIEDPSSPGNPLALTDSSGGASFVSGDYSIALASNGVSAKLIFADAYNVSTDYLVYSVFGETEPEQYGYTIPETQVFTATAGQTVFNLDNFVGYNNITDAIVEVDGLRVSDTLYTIDFVLETLTFGSGLTLGQIVAVTTYNDTFRQYLNTQFDITNNSVVNVTNAVLTVVSPTPYSAYVTVTVSALPQVNGVAITTGDVVRFAECVGADQLNGQAFYIDNIVGNTFRIYTGISGGTPVDPVSLLATYISGGVCWIDRTFTLTTTVGTRTFSANNRILVNNTDNLVAGTPVYFTQTGSTSGDILPGGLIDSQEYFVLEVAPIVTMDEIVTNEVYTIEAQGILTDAVELETGRIYQIVTIGTTDFTLVGAASNTIGIYFTATGAGTGTGTAILEPTYYTLPYIGAGANTTGTVFTGINTGPYPATSIVAGYVYTIISVGSTDFTLIGASSNTVGTTFIATGVGLGTGTARQGIGTIIARSFTVSETRFGDELVLTNSGPDTILVSQFDQTNVDRLWVTLNGYRVPSSQLVLYPGNNLGILVPILTTDDVTITTMMPTPTPNQEVYLQNVNKNGVGTVFRENTRNRTWLANQLLYTDSEIVVNNAEYITDVITQTSTVPALGLDGLYTIGLTADKNTILSITVYNNTTSATINSSNYVLSFVGNQPVIEINPGAYINVGNSLTITVIVGGLIYINGEQIRFTDVDFATNTLSGLTRGVNGTGVQLNIPQYSVVYSLIYTNQLSQINYNQTWNSNQYNSTLGDPLQISNTEASIFLKTDIN